MEIRLKIDGMHCTGCSDRLEKALKKRNHIKDAKVSFEKKEAKVVYDTITKKDIEEYIEEIGFHSLGE